MLPEEDLAKVRSVLALAKGQRLEAQRQLLALLERDEMLLFNVTRSFLPAIANYVVDYVARGGEPLPAPKNAATQQKLTPKEIPATATSEKHVAAMETLAAAFKKKNKS